MEKYHYERDGRNRPVVTVCIVDNVAGMVGRGTAVCSRSDNPSKRIGRKIARERAVAALRKGGNNLEIFGEKAFAALSDTSFTEHRQFPFYKSEFNPELTDLEKKILRRV